MLTLRRAMSALYTPPAPRACLRYAPARARGVDDCARDLFDFDTHMSVLRVFYFAIDFFRRRYAAFTPFLRCFR